MNGIGSGIDYNVLFSDSTASVDPATAILTALYGDGSGRSSALSSGNPLTDLKRAQQNKTTEIAREAKDPVVARDLAAFSKAVAGAKDIKSALANPNVLKVLLTANNLADQIPYPALAQKVLLSDPSDHASLVNKLGNTAWLNATKSFDFAKNGLKALQDPKILATLTQGYTEVKWRQSLDKATPGLSNALTFLSQASAIKDVFGILGDATNRAVVTTALGIPKQIAFQDLPAQQRAVTDRVDITRFKDPKYVNGLASQYLLAMQRDAKTNTSGIADLSAIAVQANGLLV